MQEHAVPKQITTFEFKLIGFLTVRQFLYILIFCAVGYLAYVLAPFRLIGVISGLVFAGIGAAFAFIRFNERPLDHAIRMLFVRITSPSQYFFSADNTSTEVRNLSYPTMTTTQIESPTNSISSTQTASTPAPAPFVQTLQQPPVTPPVQTAVQEAPQETPVTDTPMDLDPLPEPAGPPPAPVSPTVPDTDQSHLSEKKPFITGVVMNTKEFPLPNMLLYIKDPTGKIVRLLKTTERGQFSSFQPLADGSYSMETQDPQQRFFFDPVTITVRDQTTSPQILISKEVL